MSARVLGAMLLCLLALCGTARADPAWVAAWSSPLKDATTTTMAPSDASFRDLVRVTASGPNVRLHLTNQDGTTPLHIGRAFAGRANGAQIVDHSNVQVRFGGATTAVVPPGQQLLSDPIALPVHAGQDVAVSLYLPGANPANPGAAFRLSYATDNGAGDQTDDETGAGYPVAGLDTQALAAVDVLSDDQAGAVVALGDSITAGAYSVPGNFDSWVEHLTSKLEALPQGQRLAVDNAGIPGNDVTTDQSGAHQGYGLSGRQRAQRDALSLSGARVLILAEGVNDLNNGCGKPTGCTAPEIIAALKAIVDQAHSACVPVIGGTITPDKRAAAAEGTYDSPEQIAARHAVNDWIRTSGTYDLVADFDAAVRFDAVDPDRLDPRYDSGDHLHPNSDGHAKMASVLDAAAITRLKAPGCGAPPAAVTAAKPAVPRLAQSCTRGGALHVRVTGVSPKRVRVRVGRATLTRHGATWTLSASAARRAHKAGRHVLATVTGDARPARISRAVPRCGRR